MNIGGVFMLIVVIAAAVIGMYAIFAKISMDAPVDTNGITTDVAENLTRETVTTVAPVIPTTGVFIALIAAGILLAIAGLYVMGSQKSNFRSRY